jgi:hypothetical protein
MRERAVAYHSSGTVEELELFDSSALGQPAFGDVDEREIIGFVQWLGRTRICEYFFRLPEASRCDEPSKTRRD